jgi:hypothetical protein
MAAKSSDSKETDASQAALLEKLDIIQERVKWLTTAVFAVALALLFTVASVFGHEIDFHYGESLLVASACTGGVAMGFVFGWLARRAI